MISITNNDPSLFYLIDSVKNSISSLYYFIIIDNLDLPSMYE